MLFNSSDEDARALLEKYKEYKKDFETNLIMFHVKSEGKISLSDIYSMTYKMREQYINCHNDYVEEVNKKMKK